MAKGDGQHTPTGPASGPEPPTRTLLLPEQLDARRTSARRRRRRSRILLAAVTPVLLVVIYAGISYASYMLRPTSESFTARSAEWVRNDVPLGNWVIDTAEHATARAPRKGGPGLTRLPHVGLGLGTAATVTRTRGTQRARRNAYTPRPIKPVFGVPLPGEGVWHRAGPLVTGRPPVLVTSYRPSPEYPSLIAYVLWIDHTRTDLAYYPGRFDRRRLTGGR